MFAAVRTPATRSLPFAGRRAFSDYSPYGRPPASPVKPAKVAVLGATGGIGQPLSLLLKLSPYVTKLTLYDIHGAPGVAADLSHINTNSTVQGFAAGEEGLRGALENADVIVVPAGVPRKPGMTRDDLFNTNASIVRDLAMAAAKYAPQANMLIISNPVNSTVPIVSEVYKACHVYNPKRLFGVTTLDVVRASRFISEVKGTDPAHHRITVAGGHSGVTIVPLLSEKYPDIVGEARDNLIKRIQFGGDEVVNAKDGKGSATLSMAYAGARMATAVLRARAGEAGVTEPAFIESPLYKDHGVDFFASEVELGLEGVSKILPLPRTNDYEDKLLQASIVDLKANIAKGVKFAQASS